MSVDEKKNRAAMIPFYIKDDEFHFLFMRPSDQNFGSLEYQIAKGMIDDGETELDAAIREGKEELGLKETNIENIHKIGKFNPMTVYACSVHNIDDFDEPHYETKDTKWLTEKEFTEIGRKWQKFIVNITSLRLQKILKLNFKKEK